VTALERLDAAAFVFWDFDGTIKETLEVKAEAFVEVCAGGRPDVAAQIRRHHHDHGGLSRFEKIPLYLRWSGEEASPQRVTDACDAFAARVWHGVIHSAWVPGVESYLRADDRRRFALVSATPQDELAAIVETLGLSSCFNAVYGAPISKADAIALGLARYNVKAESALMVGDARADVDAAGRHQVPFLLRRHARNVEVFEDYRGPSFHVLTDVLAVGIAATA